MAKITHWWSLPIIISSIEAKMIPDKFEPNFLLSVLPSSSTFYICLSFCFVGGEVCILMLGLGYTISRLHNGNSLQRLAQLHGLVWFVHWNESHFCYSMGLKRLPMSRPTAQPNWGQLTPERWGNSRISNP